MGACTAFVFAALIEFTVVGIQLFTTSGHTFCVFNGVFLKVGIPLFKISRHTFFGGISLVFLDAMCSHFVGGTLFTFSPFTISSHTWFFLQVNYLYRRGCRSGFVLIL